MSYNARHLTFLVLWVKLPIVVSNYCGTVENTPIYFHVLRGGEAVLIKCSSPDPAFYKWGDGLQVQRSQQTRWSDFFPSVLSIVVCTPHSHCSRLKRSSSPSESHSYLPTSFLPFFPISFFFFFFIILQLSRFKSQIKPFYSFILSNTYWTPNMFQALGYELEIQWWTKQTWPLPLWVKWRR